MARLKDLHPLHLRPIQAVVSGCSLCLILGEVSRLDAFSASLRGSRLLSHATGVTADTPEEPSSRSSRTKDDFPQTFKRPHRIGTELSHDVLNPARVPL